MWALCYRMTGERADAEDLAQEAAARAIERADQLTGDDATGWLLALTTRLCLDHLRQRKRTRRRTELVDVIDDAESVERGPEQALLLRDVEGLTAPEAAYALGITVVALKSRLHRARETLREQVRRDAPGASP